MAAPERHKVVLAVLFVLEEQGRYLLHLRQNTGFADGFWCASGGHVEAGEHFLQAVAREAKEELGVTVKEEDMHFLGVHHIRRSDGQEGLNLYYRITQWQGTPTIGEPEYIAALQWFPANALPSNVYPEFHEVIAAKPSHFALPGHTQPRLGTLS
jgi:8-oxo-dGTP pyrophosphatase MutT (NUDIX family)